MKKYSFWIIAILSFWIMFWGLNGLDKFFNGSFIPMADSAVTKSVVMAPHDDTVLYRIQPMHVVGAFGVNRDVKMQIFFERIGVSAATAETILYSVAGIEIFIAFIGLVILIMYLISRRVSRGELLAIHALSFVLLGIFCAGDILFGERVELWEHVTFIIMVLLSYRFLEWELRKHLTRTNTVR